MMGSGESLGHAGKVKSSNVSGMSDIFACLCGAELLLPHLGFEKVLRHLSTMLRVTAALFAALLVCVNAAGVSFLITSFVPRLRRKPLYS